MKKISKVSKRFSSNLLSRLLSPPLKPKRRVILRPIGRVYNLEEIHQNLSEEYFETSFSLPITWFGSGAIPRTSILFGSYSYQNSLIKVNRVLDSEEIPSFFVRYIVYHEMLHHILPPKRGTRGRWNIHHTEFKAREQEFKEYALAQQFLKRWKKRHFQREHSLA